MVIQPRRYLGKEMFAITEIPTNHDIGEDPRPQQITVHRGTRLFERTGHFGLRRRLAEYDDRPYNGHDLHKTTAFTNSSSTGLPHVSLLNVSRDRHGHQAELDSSGQSSEGRPRPPKRPHPFIRVPEVG